MSASVRASVLPDAVSARARLRIAAGKTVEGCRLELPQYVNPLEACARHKVLAVQRALDELAGFEQAALLQLESTRDALFAKARDDTTDIQALFDVKASEVARMSTTKRVALERELVNADTALDEAIGATNTAIDVRTFTVCATQAHRKPMMHPVFLFVQACTRLEDTDVVACSAMLLSRLDRARVAVAAVPDVPRTSAFVGIRAIASSAPAEATQSLDSCMGSVTDIPPPFPHVHSFHCTHPAPLRANAYTTGRRVELSLGIIDSDFTLALLARPKRMAYSMLASKDRCCVGEHQFRLEMYLDCRVGLAGLGIPGGVRYTSSIGDRNGYSNALTSPCALPLHSWTHVAVTRRGGSYTLYFDGSAVAAVDVEASHPDLRHSNALPLRFGSRFPSGSGSGLCDPFDGDIVEAQFTPEFLNSADVAVVARAAKGTVE